LCLRSKQVDILYMPKIRDTVSGQLYSFAPLKPSDGPGVGGKWSYKWVPGVESFGFDNVERDKRDGVWGMRGLYGGGALMEDEGVPGDGGTGGIGPNEDWVAEGGGPNEGVPGPFGRYGEGKALCEVPKYGELYGEPYGESFSTTQPCPCCTTRSDPEPLLLARMSPPVHLDLAPLTFVAVGGTRLEDWSVPVTTSMAFVPTRTA
jgi:hypothetical protein